MKEQRPPRIDWFVGLDLAQAADFGAWAVVQRTTTYPDVAKPRPVRDYGVRDLRRWPLRTPYTQIVNDVCQLVNADLPIAARRPGEAPVGRPTLMVDATGVGAAVVDLFREARSTGRLNAQLQAVLITAGHTVTPGDYAVNVPKKALVSVLQVLLQTRRLKVADLFERETLVKELDNFQVKITAAANETFGAWREGLHDDLVLAVALACWRAETGPTVESPPAGAAVDNPVSTTLAERQREGGSRWGNLFGRRAAGRLG